MNISTVQLYFCSYNDEPELDQLPTNLAYILRRYKITHKPPKLLSKPVRLHPHLNELKNRYMN